MSGSKKEIYPSPTFISVVDEDIVDTILSVWPGQIFDSWTIKKSKDYLDNITEITFKNNVFKASVLGNYYYDIVIDCRKGRIDFSCSCPVDGFC